VLADGELQDILVDELHRELILLLRLIKKILHGRKVVVRLLPEVPVAAIIRRYKREGRDQKHGNDRENKEQFFVIFHTLTR